MLLLLHCSNDSGAAEHGDEITKEYRSRAREGRKKALPREGNGLDQLSISKSRSGVSNTDVIPGLSKILSEDVLVISRNIEWLDIALGYDQQNSYTIFNSAGIVLGYITEEDSFLKGITRQVLGRHRPFKAHVLDLSFNPLLTVSRPFTFINTRMTVFKGKDEDIGAIQQVWHPLRRKYELYDKENQFGEIDMPILSWDFSINDEKSSPIGFVSRTWTNIATEVFTDAGRYFVVFKGLPGQYRSLDMEKRAIVLGAAVTIDLNYYTRSSRGGGFYYTGGDSD